MKPNEKDRKMFESLGFMAEVFCFFFSGWALAKGKLTWIILLMMGFVLAFIVGNSIYQRGKNEKQKKLKGGKKKNAIVRKAGKTQKNCESN